MDRKAKAPLPYSLTPETIEDQQFQSLINPVGDYTKPIFPTRNPEDYNYPGRMPVESQTPGYAEWKAASEREASARPKVAAASAAMSGLAAGRQVSATPEASDAIFQTAGATLEGLGGGALAGAAIGAAGGPIGALGGAAIGGLTALVSGGLQSYMGLKASRRERRKQERLNKAIERKNNAILASQRADALEQQGYDRRLAAIQGNWAAIQNAKAQMDNIISRDAALRQKFIHGGG